MKIKLNLISPQRAKGIREAKKMRLVLRCGMEMALILAVFSALLISIGCILKINLIAVSNSSKINENNSEHVEVEKYNKRTNEINFQISNIASIQKSQLFWSKLFLKLNNILNSEIALSNFSNNDFTIFLVGKSNTRDALVLFKEKLEKEECFSDVKLPLSNLVSREDVVFQIEFNVKENCLK